MTRHFLFSFSIETVSVSPPLSNSNSDEPHQPDWIAATLLYPDRLGILAQGNAQQQRR